VGISARFIGMDREQVFLMPPSVRDWVPEDHLVWTVLDTVGELDLSSFYAAYRVDGHGRLAYEPSMMVALLYGPWRSTISARIRHMPFGRSSPSGGCRHAPPAPAWAGATG
jgi:hypothetical protein